MLPVTEENANEYLAQTRALAAKLRSGHRFTIENFGIGRDSGRVLSQTPMDFLKLDESLMQGLASDRVRRRRSA